MDLIYKKDKNGKDILCNEDETLQTTDEMNEWLKKNEKTSTSNDI